MSPLKKLLVAIAVLTGTFLLISFANLSQVFFQPALADACSAWPFQGAHADPANITPGQSVNLIINTYDLYQFQNINIDITNGESKTVTWSDSGRTKTRTIPLGTFNHAGNYRISTFDHTTCQLNSAFSVTVAGSSATLEAPSNPLVTGSDGIKTIPSLVISGLHPGWQYKVDLNNWGGSHLYSKNNSPVEGTWTADSSGKIITNNICDNGQADRTDTSPDGSCGDSFSNQTYSLTVKQLDGTVVGTFSFQVQIPGQGGNPDSTPALGINPCGVPGGTCDTALGPISSNATEFISKILGIAIGIAGGIALIFMVIGSIRVLASSGDQQKLNGGREMIIAAIAGLLFMVLSILILRFIDTNLVHIGFQ